MELIKGRRLNVGVQTDTVGKEDLAEAGTLPLVEAGTLPLAEAGTLPLVPLCFVILSLKP
jgi:hypothetical protein